MLDYIRYRWRLMRHEQLHRRWQKKSDANWKAIRNRIASEDELESIHLSTERDTIAYREELGVLHTRYLMEISHRLMVEAPDWNAAELWEKHTMLGTPY